MDFNKLKAFLDSRQNSMTGKAMGILPVQQEEVPTTEEIQGMPKDLQDIVIQNQLRKGGFGAAGNENPSKSSEEAMADEISAEEYGTPSFFTKSPKHIEKAKEVYNFNKLKDYLKK